MMAGGMVSSTGGARSARSTRVLHARSYFSRRHWRQTLQSVVYISLGKSAYYERILICSKKDDIVTAFSRFKVKMTTSCLFAVSPQFLQNLRKEIGGTTITRNVMYYLCHDALQGEMICIKMRL